MSFKQPSLPRHLITAIFHPWTWKMAWRDSRSQRLRLFLFALAMVSGVAGLVTLHSLNTSVEKGIDSQVQELLGSDMVVSSRQPFAENEIASLSNKSTELAYEVNFPTILEFPNGGARMVSLRALDGNFPFYGELKTEPADAATRMRKEGGILLPGHMLTQFEAKVGNKVNLGLAQFTILGVISEAAPSASQMSNFAPEAYIAFADLNRTGLTDLNSMLTYVAHLKLETVESYKRIKRELQKEFSTQGWRFQTPEDRRNQIGNALDHFERFLGILALASLGLGALGVAGAVQAHVNRRIASIAILQCLGAPRALSAAIYIAQTMVLGLLGALIGAAVGMGLHLLILTLYRESIPITITPSPEWKIVFLTMVGGFAVCCGFAMIPLSKIANISPVSAIREGSRLKASFLRSLPLYGALTGLLLGLAKAHEGSWPRAFALVGALLIAFAVVAGAAKALMKITQRIISSRWPYVIRQGVSNLYRPGNQTHLFVLSLGLGTFLVLTIFMSGEHLQQRLDLSMYEDSPSLYMVDVQSDQLEGVKTLLQSKHLPVLETSPIVTMRVQAIRGVPVKDVKNVPRWIGTREFRSTYRTHLTKKETLISGTWYEKSPTPSGPVPISLEEKIANDMKVQIGDAITLDVQGMPLEAKVTSIRKVDWSGASLNFFMVFTPDALEEAPGFYVMTTKTHDPKVSGDLQLALMKEFGNVTCIDLSQILESVNNVIRKISRVVRILASITLLAALPIVAGTFLNGRDVRLRESVLLRTLGASSRQIQWILCVEYAALGMLAGLTGILLAIAASSAFAHKIGVADIGIDVPTSLLAIAFNLAVSLFGGLALSRGVSSHPPLEVLRKEV